MWVMPAAMPSPPWPGVAQPLGFPASTSLQSQAPVWAMVAGGGNWMGSGGRGEVALSPTGWRLPGAGHPCLVHSR